MNANEPDEQQPPAAEAPAADAPAKPRRRRVAKAAVELAAETPIDALHPPVDSPVAAPVADAALPLVPTAEAEAAPAKPARAPRRKRSVVVEAAIDGPAAELPPVTAGSVAPAESHQTAVALAAASLVDGLADAQPSMPAPGAGDATDVGEPARERSRRSRNRRRRRNDRGDRALHTEGAVALETGLGDEEADEAALDAPQAPAIDPILLEPTDPNELFAQVLSGAFDVEPAAEEAGTDVLVAPKRVLAPEPDAPKLHKVLAQSGIGSRRDMEQWMAEGRVTVNGEPAHVGQRISFGDRIAVNGKPVKVRIAPPPPRVLAYHKPAGEVVSHDDPQHRPTVFRRLPRLPHGKWQSVGRLDINTEGLLLFTNSGDLANQLMHPRFGVEREYAVRSLGVLGPEQRDRLLEGVEIEGQRCGFKSIEDGGGEGVNHWYRVVITEGRNREVRKLFEVVGHAVSRLIRIRYGCVVLPRGLKRGVWVDLPDGDVRALRRLTGTERARDDDDGSGGLRNKRGRRGGKGGRGERIERSPDRGGDRGPRPDRSPRTDRPPRADGEGPMNIPNPLQQTYDKRAIQQARSTRRELGEDDPIPNPLQQTYDKRALQRDRLPVRDGHDDATDDGRDDGPIPNPLQQTYDRRFVQKSGGGGGGRGGRPGGGGSGSGGGQRQPDPMKTSMGYIGADALRNRAGKGGGRGGNRGGKSGGGGGSSGGGRGGRGR